MKQYALATVMEKREYFNGSMSVTNRQIVGYRSGENLSEETAIGSFLKQCFKQNMGYSASEVILIEIPNPT